MPHIQKNYSEIVLWTSVTILFLGISLFMGCEKPKQKADKDQVTKNILALAHPEETRPNLERFAYGGQEFFGRSIDEMIAKFGEPLEMKQTPIKNTHVPEQVDTIVDIKFREIEVQAYKINRNANTDREMILRVKLKGNWSDPDTGLGIGSLRDEVMRILGEPDKSESDMDLYTLNTGGYPPNVYFAYRNGKVSSIRWQYDID